MRSDSQNKEFILLKGPFWIEQHIAKKPHPFLPAHVRIWRVLNLQNPQWSFLLEGFCIYSALFFFCIQLLVTGVLRVTASMIAPWWQPGSQMKQQHEKWLRDMIIVRNNWRHWNLQARINFSLPLTHCVLRGSSLQFIGNATYPKVCSKHSRDSLAARQRRPSGKIAELPG